MDRVNNREGSRVMVFDILSYLLVFILWILVIQPIRHTYTLPHTQGVLFSRTSTIIGPKTIYKNIEKEVPGKKYKTIIV